MDENDRQEGMDTNTEEVMAPEQEVATPAVTKIEISDDFMNPEAPEEVPTETETETEELAPEETHTDGAGEALAAPVIEDVVIESEIEPETSASMMVEQEPATGAVEVTPPTATPESAASPEATSAEAPLATPSIPLTPSKTASKKRLIIMAVIGAVLLIATVAGAWWLLKDDTTSTSANQTGTTSSTPIERSKLGIAATVADGMVEYMRGETSEWQAVTTDTQLQEGDQVRTGAESRAVLTLDDGSAVRLDASTAVEIVSLASDDVQIKQLGGLVYSRIVPSDRKYAVTIDGASVVEALGTAFTTRMGTGNSMIGVQVFQGAVKLNTLPGETIQEGKQSLWPFGDFAGPITVTDIDIDALVNDSFMNWNLAEDQKDDTFKTKLGVLPKIQQRAEELKKTQTEAEQKQAEQAAKEKAEKEKKQDAPAAQVMRGTMSLSLSGTTFNWNYTGKAVHGYKLVYSKTNATPLFGVDEARYFDSIDHKSGTLPSQDGNKKKLSGTYNVRVCAYTANTESEPCVDYSNTATITINN